MGRNEQLDEGAGRQTWKCLDPLNCVVWLHLESMAHGCKHGLGIFGVPVVAVVHLASASGLIAR